MSFHDDAIVFITNLFKLLQQESTTDQQGESDVAQESASSTFLRLLGVISEPQITPTTQPTPTTEGLPPAPTSTLVDSFFKIQTKTVELELGNLNALLKSYKSRLMRYSRARNKIKLNRLNILIATPSKPISTDSLVKPDPSDTRAAVSKALSSLEQSGDLTGIVTQELNINNAMVESVNQVADTIPDQVGPLGTQLLGLVQATGKESFDAVNNLTSLQKQLQKQVFGLQNSDQLLFEGQPTFAGGGETLSLLNVLNVLIFLTDRQQMFYSCSQCKFFKSGSTPACTFAAAGGTALTAAVTVKNDQGEDVQGRLTQPTNSCKEVWGLDTNDYFAASDTVTGNLENTLKGGS